MMKGDLSTLKKACFYGSKVMLAGTVIIGLVIVALLVIGAGSFFSDSLSDLLESCINVKFGHDSATVCASAYTEVIVIFVLALITVISTYKVMKSIHDEHSPFNDDNVKTVKILARVYLVAAFIFLVLEALNNLNLASMCFMFFGCILLGSVLYMFALMIRYGLVLQTESDQTL